MKIPNNEILWVTYIINEKPAYAITSTKIRDVYYLYRVKDDELVRTNRRAENPNDLEKYVKWKWG